MKIKNRYRKFLSFFVALCLTVGLVLLMSIPVQAAVTNPLNFTTNAPQSGAGFVWDNTTLTLTLTDFFQDISTNTWSQQSGISLPANSTIILVGNNTMIGKTSASASGSDGIVAHGNLTIDGTGSLTVTSGRVSHFGLNFSANGIRTIGNLTINNGTIRATGGTASGPNMTSRGIWSLENIIINGGSIEAIGSQSWEQASIGIDAGAAFTINGGTVTATGGSAGNGLSRGIWVQTIFNINGGSITASGNWSAINRAPATLPASFTAWINSANADPGGDGSTSYTHIDRTPFVRIQSTVPTAAVTVNGNAAPTVGAMRTDGVDIDTGSPHFTASAAWSPDHATFAGNTDYTATVTLTAINGFSFRNFNGTSSINGTDVTLTPSTDGETATMIMTFPATDPERKAIVNDQTSANFSVNSDNLQYILDNHIVTDEDDANNNSVTLTLTVKETDDKADGAESIIELSQGRLLQFFDITVEKQINNDPPVKLPELPVSVAITIDLSEELSGKTGYTVYRYHNGVQRIGTDTDTGEYFTVSRGTGLSNVDQIIINTRRFSTFAVVENIVTLDDLDNSEDVDVQARIVDLTGRVYRIDIEWGEMKFIFTTEASEWNPDTRTYDDVSAAGWDGMDGKNNQITVSNHSNADVRVSFAVTNIELTPDVDMEVLQTNDEGGEAAVDMPLGRVPLPTKDALSIEAFLWLSGEPSADDVESMSADAWHKVGIITVTITPDGDILTPIR